MNKGCAYGHPGVGLPGDWSGAWTQTYVQADTEAGMHGFDKDYLVQQVAGCRNDRPQVQRHRASKRTCPK